MMKKTIVTFPMGDSIRRFVGAESSGPFKTSLYFKSMMGFSKYRHDNAATMKTRTILPTTNAGPVGLRGSGRRLTISAKNQNRINYNPQTKYSSPNSQKI